MGTVGVSDQAERAGSQAWQLVLDKGSKAWAEQYFGESGVAGALSAITNAVMDALRGCGVESIDVPLLPEKLWRAVRRTGPPAGAAPLEQEITRDPGSV